MDDIDKMVNSADMLADEDIAVVVTPSYLMVFNRYEIGKPYMAYSLLTGIPHEVEV